MGLRVPERSRRRSSPTIKDNPEFLRRVASATGLRGILRLRVSFALGREAHTPLRMTNLIGILSRTTLLHEAAGIFLGGAAYGQAIDLDGRDAYANWDGLTIFAAGADAFV